MFINIKSLNIISKIGLILILLLFISAIPAPILCQNKKTAIVSYNNQSGKNDIKSLEQITFSLNDEMDIDDVIIFYELASEVSPEEMDQVYKVLEKLKSPYHLIGGFNDYFGYFNYGTFISQVFDSDEFILEMGDNLILGLNCAIQYTTETGIIKIESLNKIKDQPDLNKIRTVFVFNNHSVNRIQNINELVNLFLDKSLFFIFPSLKEYSALSDVVTNIFQIAIPVSNSDSPNYFLIEEEQDTLFISQKLVNNNKSEIKTRIALHNIQAIIKSIHKIKIDSSLIKVNQIDFSSTSTIPLITKDNKIFTTLNNGVVYQNDFIGKEKFASELTGYIITNPVYYKDLFLVSTIQGDLYSLNSNNGEVLQVVGIGENITSDLALIDTGTKTLKSKAVVFGTLEGNIFCYDAFSFEQLWKQNISNRPIISIPVIDSDRLVFLNSSSSVYCVNAKSGILNWKYEFKDQQYFSSINYPFCDGRNVYSISPEGDLFALDLLLGKKIWASSAIDIIPQMALCIEDQKIILLNKKGLLIFVSSNDGKEIQKIDLMKSDLFSFIVTENNENIFIGLSDGSLYSIDSKYNVKQLISQTNIPITSINVIEKDALIIKDLNGKITFYKTK